MRPRPAAPCAQAKQESSRFTDVQADKRRSLSRDLANYCTDDAKRLPAGAEVQ